MMHQSPSSSNRKSRNRKIKKALYENNLDHSTSPGYIPQLVKKPIFYLVSLLRFGFVLIIWQKVFHSIQSVKNITRDHYSRLSLYRMVSEDYRESNTMSAKSSTSQPNKPTSTLQPTRVEVDPELVLQYKKKIENLTEEDRQLEFDNEKTLGNDCFNRSQYEAAMKHYTYCILCQPQSLVGYTNRAAAYLRMNKYSQVLEDCNEALKIDPNNSKAKYRRGLALHHKNFFREALQDFEDVVRNERNNVNSKSSATSMHYVSKIRELLYSQPREIRLLVNDINGNSSRGDGDNTGPHIIQVPEKDYRYNPKYKRCVPINEWGFAKTWCKCHNGEPEFVRSFSRELAERRKARGKSGYFWSSNETKVSESIEEVVSKSCSRDQSVNILAKGLRRSLSSDKPVAAPASNSSSSTPKPVTCQTLRPAETPPECSIPDEASTIPPVPCIRNMPLLDDCDDQMGGVSCTTQQESLGNSGLSSSKTEVKITNDSNHVRNTKKNNNLGSLNAISNVNNPNEDINSVVNTNENSSDNRSGASTNITAEVHLEDNVEQSCGNRSHSDTCSLIARSGDEIPTEVISEIATEVINNIPTEVINERLAADLGAQTLETVGVIGTSLISEEAVGNCLHKTRNNSNTPETNNTPNGSHCPAPTATEIPENRRRRSDTERIAKRSVKSKSPGKVRGVAKDSIDSHDESGFVSGDYTECSWGKEGCGGDSDVETGEGGAREEGVSGKIGTGEILLGKGGASEISLDKGGSRDDLPGNGANGMSKKSSNKVDIAERDPLENPKPARKYVKIAAENKTKAQPDCEDNLVNGHCESKVNGFDFGGGDILSGRKVDLCEASVDDEGEVRVNGSASDGSDAAGKPLTKAAKRHLRRKQHKLREQSQKEDVAS